MNTYYINLLLGKMKEKNQKIIGNIVLKNVGTYLYDTMNIRWIRYVSIQAWNDSSQKYRPTCIGSQVQFYSSEICTIVNIV